MLGQRMPTYAPKPDERSMIRSASYEIAIQDAIAWLVLNRENYQPEALAKNMALDLLSPDTLKNMGVSHEQK